jgi:hypothetical protein
LSQFALTLPTSVFAPQRPLAAAHGRPYTRRSPFLPPSSRQIVDFSQRQTFIIAILMLFAGRFLNRRFAPPRQWNIPEPVAAG